MGRISFTAHCGRNHDRIDFTDPAAFESHMAGEHGRKMSRATGAARVKPHAWRAPKAPTTTDKLTAILLEASQWSGKYAPRGYTRDVLDTEWTTDSVVPVGELTTGDVFVAAEAHGIRYAVLDTDPEKGWHLERLDDSAQAGSARSGWLRELKLPRSGVLETVVRVGRAA